MHNAEIIHIDNLLAYTTQARELARKLKSDDQGRKELYFSAWLRLADICDELTHQRTLLKNTLYGTAETTNGAAQ